MTLLHSFFGRSVHRMHRPLVALGLALVLSVAWLGCDVLEVDNPNSLIEDDLNNPTAADAIANGLEAAVTRALEATHSPYHTAADELTWIGSRDAWSELDIGCVSNPSNEFTDVAFPYMGEARWQAQEFITRLEGFRSDGDLESDVPLIRSYLNGAIIYTSVADIFDDFALSDRREGAPPVGQENMGMLYDQAISWLDAGLALIGENPDLQGAALETAMRAMRARALFSRALWSKLNPEVNTADPLVNNAEAVAAAQAALELMDGDYFYRLNVISSSPDLVVADQSQALQINNRAELGFGTRFINPQADGTFSGDPSDVIFEDIVTGEVHPYVRQFITNYSTLAEYAFVNIVSAREMHLILAEAALAGNSSVDFTEQINSLRALDNLDPYTGAVDAQEVLENSRTANLFLQGRSLADLYRFDNTSPEWRTGERDAPGTFFPITITEIRANPNVSGTDRRCGG